MMEPCRTVPGRLRREDHEPRGRLHRGKLHRRRASRVCPKNLIGLKDCEESTTYREPDDCYELGPGRCHAVSFATRERATKSARMTYPMLAPRRMTQRAILSVA